MPVAARRPEYYNALGLTFDATDEDIKTAYKKLVCFQLSLCINSIHPLNRPFNGIPTVISSGKNTQRRCLLK